VTVFLVVFGGGFFFGGDFLAGGFFFGGGLEIAAEII